MPCTVQHSINRTLIPTASFSLSSTSNGSLLISSCKIGSLNFRPTKRLNWLMVFFKLVTIWNEMEWKKVFTGLTQNVHACRWKMKIMCLIIKMRRQLTVINNSTYLISSRNSDKSLLFSKWYHTPKAVYITTESKSCVTISHRRGSLWVFYYTESF